MGGKKVSHPQRVQRIKETEKTLEKLTLAIQKKYGIKKITALDYLELALFHVTHPHFRTRLKKRGL